MNNLTGIVYESIDKSQPYRIWSNGHIIRFTVTEKEAHAALFRYLKNTTHRCPVCGTKISRKPFDKG